jgi:hypothetical protein
VESTREAKIVAPTTRNNPKDETGDRTGGVVRAVAIVF